MVWSGIFCTEANIEAKEGAGANTTITEAQHNQWVAEAESYINAETRYNWSDAYAGLNADVKALLSEAASNIAAMYGIQYDMTGYNSLAEAQTMINVLWDRTQKCIALLKDQNVKKFVEDA